MIFCAIKVLEKNNLGRERIILPELRQKTVQVFYI